MLSVIFGEVTFNSTILHSFIRYCICFNFKISLVLIYVICSSSFRVKREGDICQNMKIFLSIFHLYSHILVFREKHISDNHIQIHTLFNIFFYFPCCVWGEGVLGKSQSCLFGHIFICSGHICLQGLDGQV